MKNIEYKIKEYDILIQRHIVRNDFVRINRTFRDKEADISGFILLNSKKFLLLQLGNDFLLDGYAIIHIQQFDNIRCNKFDKTFKKIYKKEGILNAKYGIDKKISLESWQSIFNDLKKLDYHVIVECEDKDEPDFIIGPIIRVNKDKVGIRYYDPTGKLDDKPTSVKYSDITIVTFGDRYSTTFRKHLR